jgi:hypothetical protein
MKTRMEIAVMNKSDWIHIKPARPRLPLRFEDEIDSNGKLGFVLIALVILAVIAYAWIRH